MASGANHFNGLRSPSTCHHIPHVLAESSPISPPLRERGLGVSALGAPGPRTQHRRRTQYPLAEQMNE